jgi:hypothetical protein
MEENCLANCLSNSLFLSFPGFCEESPEVAFELSFFLANGLSSYLNRHALRAV